MRGPIRQRKPTCDRRLRGFVAAGLAVLGLVSCDSSDYMAGIDGSGARIFAQGPIEAFGSIVLSGVHYDVSGAEIRVNGALATESDLAVGQVVTIRGAPGSTGSPVADSVEFEADLRGPVDSVDVVGERLTVLAQEVRLGPDTILDLGPGGSLASLSAGSTVEVSGFRGFGGNLHATYLTRADPAESLRIIGRVSNLDIGSLRFDFGALVVDYSTAGLVEGFPGGGPANGDDVLVEGPALVAGALVASRIALVERAGQREAGDEAEVEGLITRFVSVTDFDVAGTPALTTGATRYEGGTAADLQLNVKIQVEGEFDATGTIVADKVEIKDGGRVY